jgi:hypothetical protein
MGKATEAASAAAQNARRVTPFGSDFIFIVDVLPRLSAIFI